MYFWRYCVFLMVFLVGAHFRFLPEKVVVDNPLVEGWKRMYDLGVDDVIRRNPDFLKIMNEIKGLKIDKNPLDQNKKHIKILNNLQNFSDVGSSLTKHLSSGMFKDITGYEKVISGLSLKDKHYLVSCNQALDKAKELLTTRGISKNNIRFEHQASKFHDVDLGIKKAGQEGSYLEAYQFKTLQGALDANKVTDAAKQLRDVDAINKITEIKCLKGTNLNIFEDGSFVGNLRFHSGLKIKGKGSGITEFHFKFHPDDIKVHGIKMRIIKVKENQLETIDIN